MSDIRPVVMDGIHVGNHVVLLVNDIGDHAVLGVWLDQGTSKVVWQAPHFVVLVITPPVIYRFIIINIVSFITAILKEPRFVESRAEGGAGRG